MDVEGSVALQARAALTPRSARAGEASPVPAMPTATQASSTVDSSTDTIAVKARPVRLGCHSVARCDGGMTISEWFVVVFLVAPSGCWLRWMHCRLRHLQSPQGALKPS
jgi:hypothetical protein